MRGTIRSYQTKSGDRWEYVIELGAVAGRREQARRRGFPDAESATAAMQAELTDRRRGQFIEPSKTTLGSYLTDWLAVTGPTRAVNTRITKSYELARVAPIAHHPIAQLQSHHIQAWVNTLATRYAPRTVRTTYHALAAALAQAVRWGHLTRNPADNITLPRTPSRREQAAKSWSAEQAAVFIAATADSPWHPFWRILLDAQLRSGEAIALRWSDLDLDRGIIHVARTMTRDETGRVIGDTTKTRESRRDISIAPDTVAVLRRQRAAVNSARLAAGPAWHALDLVFPRPDGRPLAHPTITRHLDAAIAAAGVPRLTPHGLRHTGASLLVLAGVPLVVVSRRLGHATIATTADIYAHVTRDADADAAATLERLLNA